LSFLGKYAIEDLVQKLPSGNPQHDQGTSDDTIAAVLATLNEVIKRNVVFSRYEKQLALMKREVISCESINQPLLCAKVSAGRRGRGKINEHYATPPKIHRESTEIRRPSSLYNVAASGATSRI